MIRRANAFSITASTRSTGRVVITPTIWFQSAPMAGSLAVGLVAFLAGWSLVQVAA